jgi:DUF1680 family protein
MGTRSNWDFEGFKIIIISALCLLIFQSVYALPQERDYPIRPVPFTDVKLEDAFWQSRVLTNLEVTVPFAFNMCEKTGRIDNLRKAARMMTGAYEGRRFNDSDVFKIIEGVAYSLTQYPEQMKEERQKLDNLLDEVIAVIAAAQEDDGYIYAARTVDPANPAPGAGRERWINLQGSHELYNMGHLFEAAVAHYQATGKRTLLDVAIKCADLVDRVFGPGRRQDASGHQEIEIGLVKLYRITGEKRYLDLAKFFLDQRGKPHDDEPYPNDSPFAIYNGREYRQDHIPVIEQTTAVGHAVRAAYMYAAMADVAALTGDESYLRAIERIWENVAWKKLYLTGGIGARYVSEAFGDDYELPNRTAYTETCASVGNVFWNQRMFLMTGESKYFDVLERTLYNGLLSGVSVSGDRFFYQNPLESTGGYERSEWFEVSCCPGNIVRFLPSIGGYIFAVKDKRVYVNLYASSETAVDIGGEKVTIRLETDYPFDGASKVIVSAPKEVEFELALRIPGWAREQPVPSDLYRYVGGEKSEVELSLNGTSIPLEMDKGYALIHRAWHSGDTVELRLTMPVRLVEANDGIADDRGKVAIERGPLVYCAEGVDNGGRVLDLTLPSNEAFTFKMEKVENVGNVVVIDGTAMREGKPVPLRLIPYYAWAHRGAGEMAVWMTVVE